MREGANMEWQMIRRLIRRERADTKRACAAAERRGWRVEKKRGEGLKLLDGDGNLIAGAVYDLTGKQALDLCAK
jgi:hypothetical protein